MKPPFEASPEELRRNIDDYVHQVFSTLQSEFLVLPKGEGFVDYPTFEKGYELLKHVTGGFETMDIDSVLHAAEQAPIVYIVLRSMLGFSPPEWAYIAAQRTGIEIPQGAARTLDRAIRLSPLSPLSRGQVAVNRRRALVQTACALLREPGLTVGDDKIHRLGKADTWDGLVSLRTVATVGLPYAMLLYERFLGRPFAGHRDSVSELVGDNLESAVEDVLSGAAISYRKTKRAERIPGFDQAPDFVVPSEFNAQVVIEAKVTEDDGTARDKVTRIQHLASLSLQGAARGTRRFEVIACIAGRGFGVRREDMRKLLLATEGKVFTPKTLDRLVASTRLTDHRTR